MNHLKTMPLLAALLMIGCPAAHAIDMGDASVLSQQGQRLKIAVPYGSAPNEAVAVMRFAVGDVTVPAGYLAPKAGDFVISKPERRNFIILQSRESVNAPRVQLVLNVANNDAPKVAYDLAVPPARYSGAASTAKPAAKSTAAGQRALRKKPLTPAAPA